MRKLSWFGRLAAASTCALWLGSASAGEPAPSEASNPTVWVYAKSPANGFTSVAVGTGLLAFASGAIVGGCVSLFKTGTRDDGLVGAVTLGTILPLTVVPGLILSAVGVYQVQRGARTSDDSGALTMRSNAESKRANARTLIIVGAIITGLSTVAIAVGPPLLASCVSASCGPSVQGAGLGLTLPSVPLTIIGTIIMGRGVQGYAEYDYALNPYRYEDKAAPAVTSFRLAPYASQGGSGLLLIGTF